MALSKADLIRAIQDSGGCTKSAAEAAYDSLILCLSDAIARDGGATIPGLGSFTRDRTEARMGRNPRTGEQIPIPAGYRIKFKAGKALRDRLPAA